MWEKIFWSDFWMYFNKKNNIFLKSRFVFWIWREGKGWAIFSIYIFDFWGKFPMKICWLGVSKNFFGLLRIRFIGEKYNFSKFQGRFFEFPALGWVRGFFLGTDSDSTGKYTLEKSYAIARFFFYFQLEQLQQLAKIEILRVLTKVHKA